MALNYDDIIEGIFALEVPVKIEHKDGVCFQEIVELFVSSTVPDIMDEYETPKVNFLFSDEALTWFRELLKTPFKKEDYSVKNMTVEDIERLSKENQNDTNCPTINVKDYKKFFELLTDIVNCQVELCCEYGRGDIGVRQISLPLLRRIWMRMSPEDFDNVEFFLEKQLKFLKSREFDYHFGDQIIGVFDKYTISYVTEMSETWCESTRRMHFRIFDSLEDDYYLKEYHDLPKVYYDICEENGKKVCYISAVQMGKDRHRIKSIERKLYKLNKGIPDSKVHPNFVMAMKLFYEVLRKHNIRHIKVPIMQVLSYRYHELLSEEQKKLFEEKWTKKQLEYLYSLRDLTSWSDESEYERLMEDYELDKYLYDRFVDKEDFISKNKIEGLINLFMQMSYLDSMMVINTEPYINGSYLDISLESGRKLDSKRGR